MVKKIMMKKWVKPGVLVLIVAVAVVVFATNNRLNANVVIAPNEIQSISNHPTSFDNVSRRWPAPGLPLTIPVPLDRADRTLQDGAPFGLNDDVIVMDDLGSVTFTVEVPRTGVYELHLWQRDISTSILPNRIGVRINGQTPFDEARSLELITEWIFESQAFVLDRFGNEIMPRSIKREDFVHNPLRDTTALFSNPLFFLLTEGENTIELTHQRGAFVLAGVTLKTPRNLPTYEAYLAQHPNASLQTGTLTIVGAEELAGKTNPSTRLRSERDPAATRYDTRFLRLNAIDGFSVRQGNSTLTFEVEVPTAGFYHLGFRVRQNFLQQMPVFREISINGEVPFDAMRAVPFHYSTQFENVLIGDGETPYQFFLEAGVNTITLRTVMDPYREAFINILTMMEEITELSLDIRRLTGNTNDRFRTWRIEQFIPDIDDRLSRWIETLEQMNAVLERYSLNQNPGELTNIRVAIRQLTQLQSDVNQIPNRMNQLADGDAAVAQLLGASAQVFLENGLDLEAIYVTGETRLPRANANIFVRTWESTQRFFLSFFQDDFRVGDVADDTLEIWVNYPRPYVEIMQQIIDREFTPQTGIRVQLSLMPDENKLILAAAANRAPDVALGVNHWIPHEFALRGAALDLRQFEGYEETVSVFAPGVMIPYAFEDGMFGLPLTQNFWVTFYRNDIMESLNLDVPDTWTEVIQILPEMQRFGLNYFLPMSQFGGFKPFVVTIPFIYQFGGDLFHEDGMSTNLNSERNLVGIRMMTELFTIYNVPKQVPSFFNQFRNGVLPIGIGDLGTYLALTIAAPEIAGRWSIAPHPGVMNDQGEVVRYAASGAQSSMILANTDMPEEAWEFLSWWMSTPVQVDFANTLQTSFGTEFLWNTANLEAFAQLPIPQEHIDVILAQWEFAIEASRIPGSYMVERELSNAWNRIVFNDANPRVTLDNAVRIANREIVFRMEEFGYVIDGQPVRPFRVPTIDNIHEWLKERPHD